MDIPKKNKLLETARYLRRKMTPHERKLWYCYLRKYPVKIYKQRIIDSFVVDFYCASAKLVIEIDGIQHLTRNGIQHDRERTKILEQYGLQVVRFTNLEIDDEFPKVCNTIDYIIRHRIETE